MFYWREEAKRNHRKLIVLLSNRGWHLTYINHNYTDENQTSENKNELNIFEIISFGCNIVARWLIQHWEEKNGSRSKHTEKNSKGYCSIYPKNVAKNLCIFLNFHPLKKKRKKKKTVCTCLTLNTPRQIKKRDYQMRDVSHGASINFLYRLILSGFN